MSSTDSSHSSFENTTIAQKFAIIEQAVGNFNTKADEFCTRNLEYLPLIFCGLMMVLFIIMIAGGIYGIVHHDPPKEPIPRHYTIDEIDKIVDRQRWLDKVKKEAQKKGDDIIKPQDIPTVIRDKAGRLCFYAEEGNTFGEDSDMYKVKDTIESSDSEVEGESEYLAFNARIV
jgi:hypothetical protein